MASQPETTVPNPPSPRYSPTATSSEEEMEEELTIDWALSSGPPLQRQTVARPLLTLLPLLLLLLPLLL